MSTRSSSEYELRNNTIHYASLCAVVGREGSATRVFVWALLHKEYVEHALLVTTAVGSGEP